ncbi:MAG: imidazole glycerol phosphate synthase subunit HisH [Pseudomonadota bacterium]
MLVVIDYGGANIASVLYAFERLGIKARLTDNPEEINKAEKVIFPGVGAAAQSMDYIREKELESCIQNLKQPVLGICMGMQLLFSHSEENNCGLLDIIQGEVKHFSKDKNMTIPHMGWNNLSLKNTSPLLENIDENNFFYFVHSYYVPLDDYTLASCQYADNFSAIIQKDNFYGCQFHPEKSGQSGEKILKNFIERVS